MSIRAYTVVEAAERCRCSTATIHRAFASGELHRHKVHKKNFVDGDELDAWNADRVDGHAIAVRLIERTRVERGLPNTITDETTIDQVGAILRGASRPAAQMDTAS